MGRTLDIHVACGSPSATAPSDISIPITRIGHGSSSSASSSQQQPHQSTPKTASSSVYELPLTPAPRSHRSATIPRLDLLTAPHRDFSSIFEVPPTPPGVHPAAGKHIKVREISVGCSKPSQPHPIQEEQAENASKESIRVIQVVTASDQEPHSDLDQEDDVPAVDIVIKNPPPPPKDIDFSLFLMRNARSRQELRESLKREEAGKREVLEQAEEDLETLLRRWEAAQWEEEAAARAREEEAARSASAIVQPMFPSLKDLPLLNYINSEGKIEPQTEVDTDVSVFAVYDRLKKVQYIGVSKNVKNAMRKIMGRKPGFCYYYKIYNLPRVESLPQPHSLKQRCSGLKNWGTLHQVTRMQCSKSSGSNRLMLQRLRRRGQHRWKQQYRRPSRLFKSWSIGALKKRWCMILRSWTWAAAMSWRPPLQQMHPRESIL